MTQPSRKCRFNAGIWSLVIVCALGPVSFLDPSLSAQTSSIPYDQLMGPLFDLADSSYAYPGNYRSIRDVDFKNLTVTFWNDENGKPILFQLRNGKYEVDFHPGHTSVELAGVHYVNSSEAGRENALVLYEEDDVGGSSNQEGIAQVFELAGKRLRAAQWIDWDVHYGGPYGSLDTFNENTNTLTIRSSHYQPGDAHCCVSAIDVVTFRWDGRRFHQTSVRTELSPRGIKEGKKLGP